MATDDEQTETVDDEETIQKSVTMPKSTIEQLRRDYPDALDDSERIRRAVWRSNELEQAESYQINHGSE